MAKIYGLFGAMSGKTADVVMAVRNGVQIVRKYQPIVSNPKSAAQVEARAKLKLISQLSAVMAPYIAFRKQGAVSSRNIFTKKNYGAITYADDTANVNLNAVTLTAGIVALPAIQVTRTTTNVTVQLNQSDTDLDRVVYVAFIRDEGGKMRAYRSLVVSTPGEGSNFAGVLVEAPVSPLHLYVYAYGVRDNTDAAKVIFGNLEVLSATAIAQLITSRSLLESDVTLTQTVFADLPPEP